MRKLSTKIAAFALAGLTAFAFAAGGCEETPGPGPGPDPGTELFQNRLGCSFPDEFYLVGQTHVRLLRGR